ncbi:MAG: sulfatase-like hydrolase/transferase, partial [Candidatus Sumerlaeia bacterium]|nr:sulfatase-like hydrolase/transferase [Candidatus Sumerlaeia bacterium]
YGLGKSMAEPARNRHAAYYADKSLPSFPRLPVHPWLVNNREYINTDTAIRRMAAEVSGVDDGVGEVMAALKRLNLDTTTLVVFLADQGWSGGQHGIWGMADHTRPLNAFDETMHIPLIIRHTGAIAPLRCCDRMICTYDVAPTLLNYLGIGEAGALLPQSPGRDASSLLRGANAAWDDVIFYEFLNTRVIRTPEWKFVRRHPDGPDELYDLRKDPGEVNNLAGASETAEIRHILGKRLDDFFHRCANPKYDVWKGGGSKAGCAQLKMQ